MSKDQHPDEGFLSRWSRRKKSELDESQRQQGPAPSVEKITDTPAVASPDSITPDSVTHPATPIHPPIDHAEKPPLTDADMPPLDSLDADSDYSGFLSPEVSESLRRMALRKLFHQPTFNLTDQLDDYNEDFTRFVPLGDLVTADMKHQMEHKAKEHFKQLLEEQGVAQETLLQARKEALDSLPPLPESSAAVFYQSQGRVLILGGPQAWSVTATVQQPLKPHCVWTADADEFPGNRGYPLTISAGRSLHLQGYLGAFELTLEASSPTGRAEILKADMVLDLQEKPLLAARDKAYRPPGYFAPTAAELPDLLKTLPDWFGEFSKPRYFQYDPDICVHSSSGLQACQQCIQACPAEAVISLGDRIEVNPNLCQGGGACSAACPSGALRYGHPSPAQQHDRLRRLLNAYQKAGGVLPKVLLYRGEHALEAELLAANILPFPLEELASVGAETWFAALSFGANQVLLLDEKSLPDASRQTLVTQLRIAQALLEGLGYPSDAIQWVKPGIPAEAISPQAVMPLIKPATQAGMDNKREQWFLALDHLYEQANIAVAESIALPEGAPFGMLAVDEQACTLCMACTTICPLQAISGGVDQPQLRFYSNRCVQCGLCEQGCPENAIRLQPLLITDAQQRRSMQLLYEDEQPFRCIQCQKPFATQRLIGEMLKRLSGHAMFQSERALNRLKMCEDCRVVDAVQDDAAMGQGLVSGAGQGRALDLSHANKINKPPGSSL